MRCIAGARGYSGPRRGEKYSRKACGIRHRLSGPSLTSHEGGAARRGWCIWLLGASGKLILYLCHCSPQRKVSPAPVLIETIVHRKPLRYAVAQVLRRVVSWPEDSVESQLIKQQQPPLSKSMSRPILACPLVFFLHPTRSNLVARSTKCPEGCSCEIADCDEPALPADLPEVRHVMC